MPTHSPADPSSSASSGTITNLSRLKRDSSYSLAELQEFLAQMRGRSPQEVLGMVSTSELVRGIAIATLGCVVLMAVLTVGPYLHTLTKNAPAAALPAVAASPATSAPAARTTANAETPTAATSDANTVPAEANPEAAAKALNIDEVKSAPPDVNPLDTDLDKLLDGKE